MIQYHQLLALSQGMMMFETVIIMIISATFTVFCSYNNDVECLHYNDNDDGI